MKQIAGHAIVTGGSSGIGKATAMLLARRGMHVTLMARRPEVLSAAKQEVEAVRVSPQQVVTDLSVDVSDRVAVEAAVAQAAEQSGPCDLLVTSAGIAHPGYFEEVEIEVFERTMAVNYFGTLYAVRAVVPGMMQEGRGKIVMVSSGAGIVGLFGYSPYSPTKFALRGLAESLRPELARHKIKVSIAYPPDTDTPQLAEEMKTKPPETQAITGSAKTWSPQDVAASIVAGMEKGRFVITPGWEMTTMYRVHSILQPLLHWELDRLARKGSRRQ